MKREINSEIFNTTQEDRNINSKNKEERNKNVKMWNWLFNEIEMRI